MNAQSVISLVSLLVLAVLTTAALAQEDWRQKSLDAIAANDPTVIEAIFPNDAPNSFWASMRDDGSRRDGFAEYLCLILHQHGMPKGDLVVIRIWDADVMARGEMRELGRFDCKLR